MSVEQRPRFVDALPLLSAVHHALLPPAAALCRLVDVDNPIEVTQSSLFATVVANVPSIYFNVRGTV